jgi:hypothetical protein
MCGRDVWGVIDEHIEAVPLLLSLSEVSAGAGSKDPHSAASQFSKAHSEGDVLRGCIRGIAGSFLMVVS